MNADKKKTQHSAFSYRRSSAFIGGFNPSSPRFFAAIFLFSATLQAQTTTPSSFDWKLPSINPVHRAGPLLVNYCHMDLADTQVDHLAERLAQWDVIILNPDLVIKRDISLQTIRQTNPRIKILAWVPIQSPGDPRLKVPPDGPDDWNCRKLDGSLVVPPWGGRFLNPYVKSFAWPKAILAYVQATKLLDGNFDGVMLDCFGEDPWPPNRVVPGDGPDDPAQDKKAWQSGMMYLLEHLRATYPNAIITGNAARPWSPRAPYYKLANGCMHENALGDELGDATWTAVWNKIDTFERYEQLILRFEFLQVDTQMNRTKPQSQELKSLSADDSRRFRLGLCTAMLRDNVYFGFDRGDCLHGQLWWFDEYDAPIGNPIAEYHRDPSDKGLLTRRYEHGLVAVNTTDQPLAVHGSFLDFTTKQTGSTLSVPAHDGRILIDLHP